MSTKSKPQYERVTRVGGFPFPLRHVSTRRKHTGSHLKAEFIVDAALFDMDGTLVDSIGAVETAWGNKAEELGMDRQQVIDQTHGKFTQCTAMQQPPHLVKFRLQLTFFDFVCLVCTGRRAIDNLRDLQPELRGLTDEEMEPHVRRFEETILEAADSFKKTVRSRRESVASSRVGRPSIVLLSTAERTDMPAGPLLSCRDPPSVPLAEPPALNLSQAHLETAADPSQDRAPCPTLKVALAKTPSPLSSADALAACRSVSFTRLRCSSRTTRGAQITNLSGARETSVAEFSKHTKVLWS